MFNNDFQTKEAEIQSVDSDKSHLIGRLDFIKKISLLTGVVIAGCSPVKILLKLYPERFDDNDYKKKILSAFVTTIIPGADLTDPNICRIFSDHYYPFHKYCGFFVSDLCKKSKRRFYTENFHQLKLEERTSIVKEGLRDEFTTSRLYTAAIYISQVSFYSGIYDDDKGCELIDFEGRYGFMNTNTKIDKSKLQQANEITSYGNYS